MSISYEHADYCRYCFLERNDLTPVQVERFIKKAKKVYKKCPYCGTGPVYSCIQKKMLASGGMRLLMALVSCGLSILVGSRTKVYWCSDCTSSGSGWF